MARIKRRPDTYAGSFDAMSDKHRKHQQATNKDHERLVELQLQNASLRRMLARSNIQISNLNKALKRATATINQVTKKEKDTQEELNKRKKMLLVVRQELMNTRVDAAEKDLQVKRMIAKSMASAAVGLE